MSSKRVYFGLLASIGLLVIALFAGVYGVNSLLESRAKTLTHLKAKSQALSQEHLSLAKAKQEIKQYSDLEKITHAVVPEDKNQAEATREIVNIAAANGISLGSITFPASTLGTATVGSSSSGTATPSANSAVTSVTNSKNALSQLVAVKNIPGVYQLLINVEGNPDKPVPYDKFINFLSALEHNRRTAQVSNIAISPNADNRNLLTFTLSLNEYIKP